jgi:hypothetical protein
MIVSNDKLEKQNSTSLKANPPVAQQEKILSQNIIIGSVVE